MPQDTVIPVTVYHDETKREDETRLKGHVLLFVPHIATWRAGTPLFGPDERRAAPLVDVPRMIWSLRDRYDLAQKRLHFSKIGGRKWTRFDAGHRSIAELAANILRSKPTRELPVPFSLKVAVMFYGPDADLSLYGGSSQERTLRHDETVLRMLLKGAAHFLFPERTRLSLVELVTDGLPAHRTLSESRVLWQLAVDGTAGRTALRSNVELPAELRVRPHSSDHKSHERGSTADGDSQFLQLADLYLGAISRACFDPTGDWPSPPAIETQPVLKKDVITHPIRSVLQKQSRGAGFRNNGHYRSFSVGRVAFSGREVSFRRLGPRLVDHTLPTPQLDLSWSDDER